MKTQLSPQDWQQLSAYLDGQLSANDKTRLETRLRAQTSLRNGLEEISRTRTLLRSVPRRKVPHNFTLTRAMAAEQERRRSIWFPLLGVTSLVSLVSLIVVSFLSLFSTGIAPAAAPIAMQAARSSQAEAPQATPVIIFWGYPPGVGGGGGGGSSQPLMTSPNQAYGKGGGPVEDNTAQNTPAAPEVGIQAAPTETPVEPLLNQGVPTEAPAAPAGTSLPAQAAPAATAAAPVPQEKALPNQPAPPVTILGIAPTQEQGLVQGTPPPAEARQAPAAAPANNFPFFQIGLAILTVTAGVLAFVLRKKT